MPRSLRRQGGQRGRATEVFAPCRAHQQRRAEQIVATGVVALDEGAAQVAWREAVGQARRDETAGRDADIAVEIAQVDACQHLVERTQCADLVDGAERAAAGQRQADPRPGAVRCHAAAVFAVRRGARLACVTAAFFDGAAAFFTARRTGPAAPLPLCTPVFADNSSMRLISASMSRLDGTPILLSAFSTRASKIDSSLSHCAPALPLTSPATALILLVTALMRSSAMPCVFFC